MDLESRTKWVEYSKAKDEMFRHTDTEQSPWYVVASDDKRRTRLNVIRHLLSQIPYADLTPESLALLPWRQYRHRALLTVLTGGHSLAYKKE